MDHHRVKFMGSFSKFYVNPVNQSYRRSLALIVKLGATFVSKPSEGLSIARPVVSPDETIEKHERTYNCLAQFAKDENVGHFCQLNHFPVKLGEGAASFLKETAFYIYICDVDKKMFMLDILSACNAKFTIIYTTQIENLKGYVITDTQLMSSGELSVLTCEDIENLIYHDVSPTLPAVALSKNSVASSSSLLEPNYSQLELLKAFVCKRLRSIGLNETSQYEMTRKMNCIASNDEKNGYFSLNMLSPTNTGVFCSGILMTLTEEQSDKYEIKLVDALLQIIKSFGLVGVITHTHSPYQFNIYVDHKEKTCLVGQISFPLNQPPKFELNMIFLDIVFQNQMFPLSMSEPAIITICTICKPADHNETIGCTHTDKIPDIDFIIWHRYTLEAASNLKSPITLIINMNSVTAALRITDEHIVNRVFEETYKLNVIDQCINLYNTEMSKILKRPIIMCSAHTEITLGVYAKLKNPHENKCSHETVCELAAKYVKLE